MGPFQLPWLTFGALIVIGGSMAVLPFLNGAIARVLHPEPANADLATPTLTKAVLSPWGGAIFLAGVVAAGMSTFASVLIITSGAVVRDVVQKGLGREISERHAGGVLASMGGLASARLIWIGISSPYGAHGFIPGILVSLVAMVVVSLFTERLPEDHLAKI